MANDYRVVLSGEDRLSGTIRNVRQELENTGKSGTKLDEIKRKFERIQSSAAPLKHKLRSLREMMADMNLDGLTNTDVFGQMAEQAGQYADAICDAQTAVRAFANDNMKLQAVTEGFQLITGAVGIATGAMGLLGVENEKVEQAMLKVQSAIAVMNGVQQVANLLNKDSVLMLRLKQVAITATSAATVRATAAEGAATVATKINTIAQTAWNVAKAVAKALLGDFSGLVLVGAGVLATYAIATANSTDEQNKNNDAMEKAKTVHQEFTENVAEQTGSLVGKFQELRGEWNRLTTEAEKIQWLKDNQTEMQKLGLKVNDVTSAENVFNRNTSKVVKALELRARAMAAQSMIVEQYKKYYKTIMDADNSVAGGGYYHNVKAGGKYEQGSDAMNDLVTAMKRAGAVRNGSAYNDGSWYTMDRGQFVLTQKGADAVNGLRNERATDINRQAHQKAQQELDKATTYLNQVIKAANESIENLGIEEIDFNQHSGSGNNRGGGNNHSGTSNKPNGKPKTPEQIRRETYGTIQTGIKTAIEDLTKGLFTEEDVRKRLEALNQQLIDNNFDPIDVDMVIKGAAIERLQKQFQDVSDKFSSGLIDQNQFDSTVADINSKLRELGVKEITIKTKAEIKLEAIDEFERKAAAIQEYFDRGVITLEEANKEITELNKTAIQLGQKPIVLKVKTEMDLKVEAVEEVHKKFRDVQSQFDLGILSQQDYINKTAQLNGELAKLGAKPIEIEIQTNFDKVLEQTNETAEAIQAQFSAIQSIDGVVNSVGSFVNSLKEGANAWEIFIGVIQIGSSILSAVQGVMTAINVINQLCNATTITGAAAQTTAATATTAKAGADAAAMATTTAATVAYKTQEAALLDLAAAEIFAAHASIPFAGVPIATGFITTMMAAMAAQKAASLALAAFADGGVVSGNTFHGDSVLVRANAGETILTRKQSADLYHAIKDGNLNGGMSGRVRFEISGDKLYGVLDNYNRKMNRIR